MTGVGEEFAGMPPGSRSMEIWTHRVESLFLDAFGRPDANQDPPYERAADATVVQALHLMNAPKLHRKVTSDEGRAARLAAADDRRRGRSSKSCTWPRIAGCRRPKKRRSSCNSSNKAKTAAKRPKTCCGH